MGAEETAGRSALDVLCFAMRWRDTGVNLGRTETVMSAPQKHAALDRAHEGLARSVGRIEAKKAVANECIVIHYALGPKDA